MAIHSNSSGGALRWLVDDLPFGQVDRSRVIDDIDLFYFLTGASFIEITSDLYTRSLIEYYQGDQAVTDWLQDEWQLQELQHGVALRRYVEAVWPEFDWARAYADFYRAYAPLCRSDLLGPTRGLELAARCVVETGTATIYTMIRDLTDEPVLRRLTDLIRTDEVSHYSYFFRHFKRYRADEGLGRVQVVRALWGRVSEIDDEDAWHAFRSVHHVAGHDNDTETAYRAYRQRVNERMRAYYPYGMAATMLLKPLALNPQLQRLAVPVLSAGARRLFRPGAH
ncbi:MAG TPA: ferritin-like domain-containing protein [Parasulfuritortus sp.]